MKKIYKAALVAPVVFMAFFSSCSKDETAKPKAETFSGVSANSEGGVYNLQGMLAFSDTTAFLRAINSNAEKSNEEIRAWEQGLEFSSLRSAYTQFEGLEFSPPTDPLEIEDEYFASVLNMDRMVCIHDWIFKVDIKNDKVSVIKKENTDLISKLKAGESDSRIKEFSTDDDVFYELYNGNGPNARVTLLCGQSGAQGDKADNDDNPFTSFTRIVPNLNCNRYRFEVKQKQVYQKAGIYFSLVQQMKYMKTLPNSHNPPATWFWTSQATNMKAVFGYGYRPKCGNSVAYQQYTFLASLSRGESIIEKRWYSSTTALHKYKMTASFEWVDVDYPANITTCPGPGGFVIVPTLRNNTLREIQSNW